MQISTEVRRVLSKKPNSIKMGDFKLKFQSKQQTSSSSSGNGKPAASNLTAEQAAAMSKARWFGAVGFRPKTAANPASQPIAPKVDSSDYID